MTISKVPLSNTPQTFSCSLGGNTYNIALIWNELQGWIINIQDVNLNNLLSNIPLTTGRDLLEPHASLNFGGSLFVFTNSNDLPPTIDNLGVDSFLYFVTD